MREKLCALKIPLRQELASRPPLRTRASERALTVRAKRHVLLAARRGRPLVVSATGRAERESFSDFAGGPAALPQAGKTLRPSTWQTIPVASTAGRPN